MKKYLFLIPVLLLALTGCGKKQVVCSASFDELGMKYEAKITGTLKDDKIDSVSISMKFEDESKAKQMCSLFELANGLAEKEEDKIDYKCNGKEITFNSIEALDSSMDDTQIKGLTADEFIELMTKNSPEKKKKK